MRKSDWYTHIWSLNIKNLSWTEDTENQVDFVIKVLELTGKERILDLACGFGRHSLSFARRGFSVVGVDITKAYIDDATNVAQQENLSANFIHSDIRDLNFDNEFDVVLNLADGAIGYLENDEENLKIYDVISKSLKYGGKHFMDIVNADHAEKYFPKKTLQAGEKSLSLAQFDWDSTTRCWTYGSWAFEYGKPAEKPNNIMENGYHFRLYSLMEVDSIWKQRGLNVISSFSNYYGKESTDKELQLIVCSQKGNNFR